jgi:large subunit ribosomal protein L6
MSRIGKRPIPVPKGVNVKYEDRTVLVKGPKGENRFAMPASVELQVGEGTLQLVADYQNDKLARTLLGTAHAVVANMVQGVSQGFAKKLQLVGVGYRASVSGSTVELLLGYSKPVKYALPKGVAAQVEANTQITLTSHDNVLLGQTAANIRALRPPEPYQGKGISYENEKIRRKAGKTGKK